MMFTASAPLIHVHIVAAGQTLREHRDPDVPTSHHHFVSYIEAQTDQVFEIECKWQRKTELRGNCIEMRVFIDGEWMDGKFLPKQKIRKKTQRGRIERVVSQGRIEGDNKIRRFCFARLDIEEDAESRSLNARKLEALGTIQVELFHMNMCSRPTPHKNAGAGPQTIAAVSEKQLKGQAVSHSVGFTEAEDLSGPSAETVDTKFAGPGSTPKPFAVYEFRYRSREALKSMLVIPRTPSPEPGIVPRPGDDRDLEDMSKGELCEYIRQSRAAHSSHEGDVKVKREPRSESPRPIPVRTHPEDKVKIKQEPEPDTPRRRKVPASNGDITTLELNEDGAIVPEKRIKLKPQEDSILLVDRTWRL